MKQPIGLKVIECKYCYAEWDASLDHNKEIFTSKINEFKQRRDVDLYHLCGVYRTAGIPVEIDDIDYKETEARQPHEAITRSISDSVCQGVASSKAVILAGGYCNYAPAVAGGIQRAIGKDKKIGVVWIDAHTDNQRLEDYNEPVRLVAVPMSTMVGQTLPDYRTRVCGLEVPIDGRNVIVSDARITDPDEEINYTNAGIHKICAATFQDNSKWQEAINKLSDSVDALYLSVDADILKHEYIPAYEDVVLGGHDIEIVMNNIATVINTGKVSAMSLFCIDFDHYERNGGFTYLSGMKLLASALNNWRNIPNKF